MCLGGGSVWLRWREAVKVSFWSVLPVLLFVITTSSHACFSLSRAIIDVAFHLERRGGLGLTWIRCFGFVMAFLVMWVRFVSCEWRSSFAFLTASNAFLSLIVISFDRSFNTDALDTLGWAWNRLIASVLSFLVTMVRGEHGCFVLFVALRLPSDNFFHYHCMKKLCNRYRTKIESSKIGK
jgi:hypothetical protein